MYILISVFDESGNFVMYATLLGVKGLSRRILVIQ